jgi:hypothetical protein
MIFVITVFVGTDPGVSLVGGVECGSEDVVTVGQDLVLHGLFRWCMRCY